MEGTRLSRRVLAALIVGTLMLALVPGLSDVAARAQTAPSHPQPQLDRQLQQARKDLRKTRHRIRDELRRLRKMTKQMDHLATRISKNRSALDRTKAHMEKLKKEIARVKARLAYLEALLAERSRQAYILGPGTPLMYLLTASSAADAASRIVMLDEMNRRDAVLADQVDQARADLGFRRESLARVKFARRILAYALKDAQKQLAAKMAKTQRLWKQLKAHKVLVLDRISRLHPFAMCPVQGPVAIADDFGIWVHRPKNWGGDHIHQGNDMMAAMGTPIVAPFDGVAVDATNHIGGTAVKVIGKYGYVYNAHLSRFGQLGPVTKGTVVGYVGATGNAGGPHDHFEWHPGGGDAVDPHPFLMQVC
ncbi:MAG TPA: peptidoglycan DD-metalloendopeptidase family protein [Actinomycetota bacterium]|jgi:murein DD-endopeptidase MepM/ murein hydrolase activator NlpD|nr:peptidoglycan DD-metalloendopeptidase family protein [Actinomycetota bacterium]